MSRTGPSAAAQELRQYIESLPFFDTHSHVAGFDFGTPVNDKAPISLPQLLLNDYLLYLEGSCSDGQPVASMKPGGGPWTADEADQHFRALLPLLDKYRAMPTWAALREGIRAAHPFEGEDITLDNWRGINDSIVAAYTTHGHRAWHRRWCERAGIVKQNQMAVLPYVTDHWDSLPASEREAQKRLLAPSLILDGYLFSGFASGTPGRKRSMELVGMQPRTHAEYLAFCGKCLDLFKARGGWSVKLLTAYHRPLYFAEVPDAGAVALFARDPEQLKATDPAGFRRLQDNLCWHLLEMSRQRGLPLIVHCGYSYPASDGDAEQMLNLVRSPRLKGLKIDICHSNWPNEGKAMILARTFREFYFNLCWTPLLSPTVARRVLAECIDILPRNKVLTGIDCGSIEHMVGTAAVVRRQLWQVLVGKVEEGQFGYDVARDWAKAILLDNACEFYGVDPDELVAEAHARPQAVILSSP